MKEKKQNLNGATPDEKNNGRKVEKSFKGPLLHARDFQMSKKELARLAALKAYFDTLDEETHIREFEQLSLGEMHYLACAYLAEPQQNEKKRSKREKRVADV